jgi:glycosyltransferase involved in cell wall biosynthesis
MTTDAVGGVWRYSVDLAEGLAGCNIQTVLAVLGPSASSAQRAEAETVHGLRLVETGLPLDWTATTSLELAQASERLAGLAALAGVGSVHLHAAALVGAARWPAPVVSVAHSCMATWWRAVRDGPMPDDFAWRSTTTRAGLLASREVIAPTAAHARATEAAYGPMPIHVVHNGSHALPASSRPRRPGVLTAGRLWDAGKGADWLDHAAPGLGVPILAAGPTRSPDGSEVRFGHLRLLGTLGPDALAAEYAGVTVFASMAQYEPFGLAVLEAAQSGMALVLSDTPGFRELWDGAAIFVADEAGLLPALRQAIATPEPWAARAQERARRYTIEKMVAGTLAVHRGVAAWA